MSVKPTKIKLSFMIVILGIIFFILTCTRDKDPDEMLRETLTSKLTGEINADTLESYTGWMQGNC